MLGTCDRRSGSRHSGTPDPLTKVLEEQGFAVLDGGLATALEAAGHNLSDGGLWSARLISEDPDAIASVHQAYFDAGADVAIAATYQASFQGFAENSGAGEVEAADRMRRGVEIAVESRNRWWAQHRSLGGSAKRRRLRPLVAASVGPYGAAQGDGSEYDGQYSAPPNSAPTQPLTVAMLQAWHAPRLAVLAACPGVDVLAFETIPSLKECEAIVRCLLARAETTEEEPPRAWISFSCRDGKHLNDGATLSAALELLHRLDRGGSVNDNSCKTCDDSGSGSKEGASLGRLVVGVGVNCTAPIHLLGDDEEGLVAVLRDHGHGRHVVLYPNSGEGFDAVTKQWIPPERAGAAAEDDFAASALKWVRAAGSVRCAVGGCCRIDAGTVRSLRRAFDAALRPSPGRAPLGQLHSRR